MINPRRNPSFLLINLYTSPLYSLGVSLNKSPLGVRRNCTLFPFILSSSSACASFSKKKKRHFRSLNFYPSPLSLKTPIILRLSRDSRVYVKKTPQSLASAAARPFPPSPSTRHVTVWVHLQATHSSSLRNPFGHCRPRPGLSLLSVFANSRNQLKSDSELRVISLIHNTLRSPITLVYHERVPQPS
jgi:hypothetical protein